MPSCLSNIVSISDPCAGVTTPSLSGLDLMQAPEITVGNLAAMATETYNSGLDLARQKLDLAVLLVQNDFIAALHTNNYVANMDASVYDTSAFYPTVSMGLDPSERGVIIHKSTKVRGRLRKLKLQSVVIYPLTSDPSAQLNVYDSDGVNETAYRYNIALIAGQENIFDLDLIITGTHARITVDNTAVEMASAPVTCFEGCNGTLPNDCGYARGWDGTKEVKKGNGYGINVRFSCECDFSALMCNMSRTYIGQLVWLKARILIMEEHMRSNRFDNWVVYNREDTDTYRKEVIGEYQRQWEGLIAGMYNILRGYRDDCITCRGIKWHTNI